MTESSKSIFDEFKHLIEEGTGETPLQAFLGDNPEILEATFYQGSYFPTVFPKFRLAGDFIPDFVMIGHRSSWAWDVHMIEIEPSVIEEGLFNRKREAKGRLRDAETQIIDWQAWMEKYRDTIFVPKALEQLKEKEAWDKQPKFYTLSDGTHQMVFDWYHIIIGRRIDFDGWGRTYQQEKLKSGVEIVPWDRLLDKVDHYPA